MNGLLDFIKTPEGQGLLSAAFGGLAGARRGQPLNSIGRAGLAGLQGYGSAQDRVAQDADAAFNKQFKQAQLKKLEQDAAGDAQKSAFFQSLLNPGSAALGAGAAVGDVGPTKTNAERMTTGPVGALSKLPQEAVQADIAINGGKNVAEWLFKTGMPDMQVSDGYAFNKNDLKPGFMPSLNTSNDGKSTMTTIENGVPVVSAPKGAMETFGGYQSLSQGITAGLDTMPIVLPDGTTIMTTRKAVADAAAPSGPTAPPTRTPPAKPTGNFTGSGYQGGSATNAATEQRAILQREIESAKAQGRTADVAALNRELERLPGGGQVLPGVRVQGSTEKMAAEEGVKSTAASAAALQKDRVTARKFINKAKEAERLLLQNPTGSVAGSYADRVMGALGMTSPSANTAQSLKAVSGWLVSNVPRMEGPQSNFDVDNYKVMAADVGNDQLPVERRLASLREVIGMLDGVGAPDGGGNDKPTRKVVKTGTYGGKKVIQYDDGSTEYAN